MDPVNLQAKFEIRSFTRSCADKAGVVQGHSGVTLQSLTTTR